MFGKYKKTNVKRDNFFTIFFGYCKKYNYKISDFYNNL